MATAGRREGSSQQTESGHRAPIDGQQLLDRRGVRANVAVPWRVLCVALADRDAARMGESSP